MNKLQRSIVWGLFILTIMVVVLLAYDPEGAGLEASKRGQSNEISPGAVVESGDPDLKDHRSLVTEEASEDGGGGDAQQSTVHSLLFAGFVIDKNGPLGSGGITARSVTGKGREYSKLGKDGSFKLLLDRRVFSTEYVKVTVADGFVTVFNGMVRASKDARIHVVSSHHNTDTGKVVLPDNDAEIDWFVRLTQLDDGKKKLVGVSSSHQGKQAEVIWRLFDKSMALVEGPVDAVIAPMAPRTSVMGHRRFPALADFRSSLAAGIVFPAPRKEVKIRPNRQLKWKSIVLMSAENMAARYYATESSAGTWEVGLPSGEYLGHAESIEGKKFIGSAVVGEGKQLDLHLQDSVPGPKSLTISLRDGDGIPIQGLYVQGRSRNKLGIYHQKLGSKPTGASGVVEIDGLLNRVYEVAYYLDGRTRVVLGEVDVSTTDYVDYPVASAASVEVAVEGGNTYGVDQIEFHAWTLWWKLKDAAEWQEVPKSGAIAGKGWRVAGLPIGAECAIAARCGDWGGVTRFLVRNDGVTVVRIEALETLHGNVIAGLERKGISGAKVSVQSDAWGACIPKWDATVTTENGAFEMRIPMSLLSESTLVASSREHGSARQECAAIAGPVPCTIVLR